LISDSLKRNNSKSLLNKRTPLREYITLSPKIEKYERSPLMERTQFNDYKLQSFLQNNSFFEKFRSENTNKNRLDKTSRQSKLQRELNNISQLLGKDLTPVKSLKNKPIVNLKKPELNYKYQSYFCISPLKKRESVLSASKIFKNVNMKYSFTEKFNNEFKLKKYSKNDILVFSKSIKPNDSFEEFIRDFSPKQKNIYNNYGKYVNKNNNLFK